MKKLNNLSKFIRLVSDWACPHAQAELLLSTTLQRSNSLQGHYITLPRGHMRDHSQGSVNVLEDDYEHFLKTEHAMYPFKGRYVWDPRAQI